MFEKRFGGAVLCLAALVFGAQTASGIIISEIMSSNRGIVVDEDGDFPDWIELYNESPSIVNLAGWALTDDTGNFTQWQFPDVPLAPGNFLLVFTSGKDRRNPGKELHTNFKLDSGGEFLMLTTPFGQVASILSPGYPEQVQGTSYGAKMESRATTVVGEGATAKYFVPTAADFDAVWKDIDFDDASWPSGPTGIGFDQRSQPNYAPLIRTDVGAAMRGINTSMYVRIPFVLTQSDLAKALQLKLKFADGFIASVNGREIARAHLSGTTIRYSSRASAARTEDKAVVFEFYPTTDLSDVLRVGTNVLAIQGLNETRTDDDCFVLPVLELTEVVSVSSEVWEYFAQPTPRAPNAGGMANVSPRPDFSRTAGAFSQPFDLTLTGPSGAEIRYTLDNKDPTNLSTLYTLPIRIEKTVQVRARVYQTGTLPGPVAGAAYFWLQESLLTSSSNLPVVIINTFGRQVPAAGTVGPGIMGTFIAVIDRGDDNRAHLDGTPNFWGLCGIKRRGSSTGGDAKGSYGVEIQDGDGWDQNASILDFPADSDFVFYGANYYDNAMIRNPVIYDLSNQCGRYAPRSRMCELWLNTGNGQTTAAHYQGVYPMMEHIKRGTDRVNVQHLYPSQNTEPEISGGYMFKVDRGTVAFTAGGQSFVLVSPALAVYGPGDHGVITAQQRTWITNYINQAYAAVQTNDPRQYERFIDVDSWIDHHILMVFPKNVDAFRLSGYWFKDREAPLELGPIWDYDRSMGSTDGRDIDPLSWPNNGGDGGTAYFSFGWFNTLFKGKPPTGTDEWSRRYRARWRELRAGPLATENIMAVIDGYAAEIGEAAARNWQKWRIGPGDYKIPINNLKTWLTKRVAWIDGQFIEPPAFSPAAGQVASGTDVTISGPEGDIYYTLDGTDPKAANGSPAAGAVLYAGPIRMTDNIKIQARIRIGAQAWSEMATAIYYTSLLPLVVTEVMYNPGPDPNGTYTASEFRFIEIKNVGAEPVDLAGVSFVDRVKFDFAAGQVTTLQPGGFAVIVKNLNAFALRYGDGLPVAGQFTGSLSTTTTAIKLVGSVGEPLCTFTYRDIWYPETDGQGYSLVIRDPLAPRETWDAKESWGPSTAIDGSPGADDGGVPPGRQVPGDLSQDGRLTISDPINLLHYLFGSEPNLPCTSEAGKRMLADVNGDGTINLADPLRLLAYLFTLGDPPTLGTSCIPMEGCPTVCAP